MHLIFRGTNSFQDIISDIDIRTVHFKRDKSKIQVHEGFYKQFIDIEPQIKKLINKETIKTLYISGHSLGAGIAQIAAAFYGEKNKEVNICTIGCPRTGNDEFVKWFMRNIKNNLRIVNKNDPIPTIPMLSLWTHTNNSILLKNNKYIFIPFEKNNIWKWLRQIINLTSNINYDMPIKAHKCDEYISHLINLKQTLTKNL